MTTTESQSTTSTMKVVDWDTIMDDSIPCHAEGCPNEVQWLLTMKCCGKTAFFCQKHHDRAAIVWASVIAQGHMLGCVGKGGCGTVWTDLNIDIRWDLI